MLVFGEMVGHETDGISVVCGKLVEEKVPGTTPSPGINIGRKVLPSNLKQRKLASISFSSSGAMGGGADTVQDFCTFVNSIVFCRPYVQSSAQLLTMVLY